MKHVKMQFKDFMLFSIMMIPYLELDSLNVPFTIIRPLFYFSKVFLLEVPCDLKLKS